MRLIPSGRTITAILPNKPDSSELSFTQRNTWADGKLRTGIPLEINHALAFFVRPTKKVQITQLIK